MRRRCSQAVLWGPNTVLCRVSAVAGVGDVTQTIGRSPGDRVSCHDVARAAVVNDGEVPVSLRVAEIDSKLRLDGRLVQPELVAAAFLIIDLLGRNDRADRA